MIHGGIQPNDMLWTHTGVWIQWWRKMDGHPWPISHCYFLYQLRSYSQCHANGSIFIFWSRCFWVGRRRIRLELQQVETHGIECIGESAGFYLALLSDQSTDCMPKNIWLVFLALLFIITWNISSPGHEHGKPRPSTSIHALVLLICRVCMDFLLTAACMRICRC